MWVWSQLLMRYWPVFSSQMKRTNVGREQFLNQLCAQSSSVASFRPKNLVITCWFSLLCSLSISHAFHAISRWCIHFNFSSHLMPPSHVKSISIRNWSWWPTSSCWCSTYHMTIFDKRSFSASLYSFLFWCIILFCSCHSGSMSVSHIRRCKVFIRLSECGTPDFFYRCHPSFHQENPERKTRHWPSGKYSIESAS